MEISIPTVAVFDVLINLPDEIDRFCAEGSTRSGKTYSIIQYLIYKCLQEKITVRCFRFERATCRKTVVVDFIDIMAEQYKMFDQGVWNKSELEYTFPNGSVFAFSGTSDSQKLQGCKQDIAWLEEAMEVREESFTQIEYRTAGLILFSFNPSISRHWIFRRIIPRDNTVYNHSTYKDNPFLTKAQVDAIESYDPSVQANVIAQTADAWKWAVYGLGKRGKIEGAVYPLFGLTPYSDFPSKSLCSAFGYGLDFGYSVDPTALVECRMYNGDLYVKLLTYERELLVQANPNDPHQASIQERLKDNMVSAQDLIVCDSAEPRSIKALKLCGYSTVGVEKGPGSKLGGITQVKTHRIFLAEEDSVLIESFEQYKWKKLSNGVTIKEPDHHMSDVPDAVRYFCMHHTERVRRGGRKQTRSNGRLASRLSRYGR